jgi:hypothetical protein
MRRWLPFPLFLPFDCALSPVAVFRDASPSMGRDRLPELSGLADARKGEGAGIMKVPESVGGLEDEGAIDVA